MEAGGSYDLAVIGGGVNGCGIARDAQGRGLSVFLAEMGDIASATSSASTKLVHGGLRYLEQYEFRLVREALVEREVLLASAPHIVWPLRFILPHHSGLRPWLVIRLGLFLYDHLGGRKILPPTRSLDLARSHTGLMLKKSYRRAFEYSDCWVDDARLVVLNARDAADRGADILTRTKCVAARREGGLWHLTLQDQRDGSHFTRTARGLVNAGGPWVSRILSTVTGQNTPTPVRMVKGSHLVVEKIFDGDRAYIFQNADGRICFAIPYESDFTLIGTTDEDFYGDPATVTISEQETQYLLGAISEYLEKPLTRDIIRWSYAGVRPLYDDGAEKAQEATRDYVLEMDAPAGEPPLLSVFGGKITTYRRLAEQALEKLASFYPDMRRPWTRHATLPGGDIPIEGFDKWVEGLGERHAALDQRVVRRLCRAYGSRAATMLSGVSAPDHMGRDFGGGLSQREVDYLMAQEWAETAEDILWRRSKLGLHLNAPQLAALDAYVQSIKHKPLRAIAGGRP